MRKDQNVDLRKGDHKQLVFDVKLPENMNSLENLEKIYWYCAGDFTSGETFKADEPALEIEKADMLVQDSTIRVDINSTDSQSLVVGNYKHELRVEDLAGNISTIARGNLKVFFDNG